MSVTTGRRRRRRSIGLQKQRGEERREGEIRTAERKKRD